MSARGRITMLLTGAVLVWPWLQPPAAADGPKGSSNWLAALAAAAAEEAPPPGAETGWQKPGLLKALSCRLEYTLATDYIWRGINFSEYRGEGREKLNHQLLVGFEIDPSQLGTAPIGRFGGTIWFEWFAGQERLTDWSGENLQEVDYTVYWAYDVEPIGLGVEVGWIAYHFPRLRDSAAPSPSDGAYTHELYVTLRFDDSKLFGRPMLNPAVTYYHDLDDVQAGFLIAEISHDFALAKCFKDTPLLKGLTITPSLALAVDHRYYDKSGYGSRSPVVQEPPIVEVYTAKGTQLAYLQYGLEIAYDLGGALALPKEIGGITLKGFLNYTNSFHDSSRLVQDEFWGGMSVSWDW